MMNNWTLHYDYRARVEEIIGPVVFASVIKQPNNFLSRRLQLSFRDVQNSVAQGDFIESPTGSLWYKAEVIGTNLSPPDKVGLNIKHLDSALDVPMTPSTGPDAMGRSFTAP